VDGADREVKPAEDVVRQIQGAVVQNVDFRRLQNEESLRSFVEALLSAIF